MKTTEQRLAWALANCERGHLRMTPVRSALLAFLAAKRSPVSLERLEQVEGIRDHCDSTTVYRTLMMFKDAELVRVIGSPRKSSLFVLNVPNDNSHFLICESCGAVAELELPPQTIEAVRVVAARHGLSGIQPHVEVHGLCVACAARRSKSGLAFKLIGRANAN